VSVLYAADDGDGNVDPNSWDFCCHGTLAHVTRGRISTTNLFDFSDSVPSQVGKNYQFWSVCELVDNPYGCWSEDKGVTTLLSTAHPYTWLSEAPSMEYRGVSRLWARVRCARTFPEMTDETGI